MQAAEVVANMEPEYNKNYLNAIHQRLLHNALLEYIHEQYGPCHDPIWRCNIYLDKKLIGIGGAMKLRQDATDAARESAIEYLRLEYHEQDPDAFP